MAGLGGAEAEDGGARCDAGGGAGEGVLHHRAAARVHAQGAGGGQVDVGVRLGTGLVVAAEDAALEQMHHPGLLQLQPHLAQVGTGGAGDAAAELRMDAGHRLRGMADCLQAKAQLLVAASPEFSQPGVGERPTGLGLDARALVLHRLAHEDGHALGQRQAPAGLLQHVAQHAVGDALAVDEHAIAVKQHGVESGQGGQMMSPSR